MKRIFLGILACAVVAPAHAQLVKFRYDIYEAAFSSLAGSSPPLSIVEGSFTVEFDASAGTTNDTTNISMSSFSLPMDTPTFDYQPWDDVLIVRGHDGDYLYPNSGTDDWAIWISNAMQGAFTQTFQYSSAGIFDIYAAGANGLTATQLPLSDPTSLPEPAGWMLMLCGFGLVGVVRRRHKRSLAFV